MGGDVTSNGNGYSMDGLPGVLRKWWPVLTLIVVVVGWFIRVDWYITQNQERDAAVNVAIDRANRQAMRSEAMMWSLHYWAEGVSERFGVPPPPDVSGLVRPSEYGPNPSKRVPPGWADAFADEPKGEP